MNEPSFNLWTEPWITVEQLDGSLITVSLETTLLHAHEYHTLYDPSPLVIVGIHRLLTAIIQDIFDPQREEDLIDLWEEAAQFPESRVHDFGNQYATRFDLFSPDAPFMQSADLPVQPGRKARTKTVTYLMHQLPAGSAVAHYHHGKAEEQVFCPICAVRGLLTISPFATAGGAGIKPSINGVPPIYVIPGGESLFESLAASLILPEYQPEAASQEEDRVWWKREPVVERKTIVHDVGYLHSLTFPARRVRLHPEPLSGVCTRCGRGHAWGVRTMIYKMGESRPKKAMDWRDPFAAYVIGKKGLVPIRSQEGKALWREFAALFLPVSGEGDKDQKTLPARVLHQRGELGFGPEYDLLPFRCIGMRTDMRMKVFEWIDTGFDVPVSLIHDSEGADEVRQALDFAADCAGIIKHTFRKSFGGEGKTKQYETLNRRMVDAYWGALAAPFRTFVLQVAAPASREAARRTWIDQVVSEGKHAFKEASETVGDDAEALKRRVQGQAICGARLGKKRKQALAI
jgi:CRISPR system Cascade subunit CasA